MDESRRRHADELIALHAPLAHRLTAARTSYQSQHIPVTPYILVACAETYSRYPEMMRAIDAAMPVDEIGRSGRMPGSQVNTVFLWSIANFYLVGRKVFTQFDPSADKLDDTARVLDFWERAAHGFRGDGTRLAAEGGDAVRVYDEAVVAAVRDAVEPVGADRRDEVRRWNATLVNHLFQLYFDTRVGAGDTGPYELGGGRVLVLRDYYGSRPDFWWADAAPLPFRHLLAGFVLDGVQVAVNDFGTSTTTPEAYLDRLAGFALFTTDGCARGDVRPLPVDALTEMATAVAAAHRSLYRRVATMSADEMIRCGASVYFSFLRPFAEVAGVADALDWTVPRDLPEPVYRLLVQLGRDLGSAVDAEPEPAERYYLPIAEGAR